MYVILLSTHNHLYYIVLYFAKEDFLKIVRQLADAGLSLLVSSHDWGESLNNYDQVIVLDKSVLAVGSPDQIKDKLDAINISSIKENNFCD